ncbi:MAG: hypothetical protein NVV57_10720 [Demequina sp.]|jgi:hypothetical protein|nr:hypothetical protein [Demequina sp.]
MEAKELSALAKRIRTTTAQLEQLTAARDAAIRDALAGGTAVTELAAIFGLSIPRVYQIRDGRR